MDDPLQEPIFDDFDERILRGLGRLLIDYASLEEALREAVGFVLESEETLTQVVLSGMSFSQLVDRLAGLCAEKYDHVVKPELFKPFWGALTAVNARRNSLVHSIWMVDIGTGGSYRLRHRIDRNAGLKHDGEDVTPFQVEALLMDMRAIEAPLWQALQSAQDAFEVMGRPEHWGPSRRPAA